ncbi:putative pectinacetylesterase/NOTUM [Helianthus annuus]|uniref:Pectin acetylesterase n=1 Tax=Helianthus annuus TaxID=4232 RepID=A0A9K3DYA3_HELAN|nr:putative pectinacetylesterase/NOTUM [Helianthus annuus]KAJ0454131.1 putative pectinacetylesterase/NOTUM [Helianthus annuus]KAJ0471932.1 putative pectinacetylesterase/NOTUM [Helianthus annuus]KAJ0651413.1 putative pectinacetylesterase/NOTUM [Helianthus annuus]KAJ0829991.1 putative pectinacetylesterase/NOTUM [Helianthus annuus]
MKWASSWSKFSFKGVGSFSQGVMDVRCGYGICCHGEEFQCLFPENVVQEIETPLFVTNTAYDSGQIKNAVAPGVVDPHGKWHDCKMDIEQCSSDQIEIIQGWSSYAHWMDFLALLHQEGCLSTLAMPTAKLKYKRHGI